MKKLISVICLLLFYASITLGQSSTSMTIGIVTGGNVNDTISVPITVNNFINVGAISLKVSYDQSVLSFVGVSDSKFTATGVNGVLAIGWYDASSTNPINLNSGTLLNAKFLFKGGSSNLNFVTSQCEIANKSGDVIQTNFINGKVGSITTLSFGSATVSNNVASVPLNVTSFKGIGAVSLKIKYDPAVLTYKDYANAPANNFTINANNGVLTIGWFDTTPLTIADNGKFVTLNFTYTSGQSGLNFDAANCEISNATGDKLLADFKNGTIGNAPILTLGAATPSAGKVAVPLNVTAFKGVAAVSVKIKYDPSVMTFKDATGGPANNFSANASNGVLTIGWFDTTPYATDNAKFVTLNFDYIGGSSALTFDKPNCEISNAQGNPISASYVDGLVGVAPTITIGKATMTGTAVAMPISVKDFTNIGAVSLKIKYDPSVMTYVNTTGVPANNFSANASNGVLTIGWFDTTPMNVASGTFVTLNFTYKGGSSAVTFDKPNCEISNAQGNAINASYVDGLVGSTPALSFGSATIANNIASIPMNVKAFKGVGAVSLKIKFDATVLTYKDYSGSPSSNFTANASNGVLTIGWFDTTPYATDSAKFVTLNFTYNGAGSAVSFDKPNCEISSADGTPITASYTDGFIGSPLTMSIPRVGGLPGDVTIPVNVKDFKNIGAVSVKISYDSNILEYKGFSNGPANNFSANASNGVLTLGWFDTNAMNITDGSFVNLNFKYNGGSSALNFSTSGCEIANVSGQAISVVYTNGSIEQHLAPVWATTLKDSTIKENVKFTYTFKANDPNNLVGLVYKLVDKPAGATIDSTTGLFTWTPDYNAAQTNGGKYKVTVSAAKGSMFTITSSTATLTVTDVNRAPYFTAVPNDTVLFLRAKDSLAYNKPYTFTYKGKDDDGDKFTFAIVGGPYGATINDTTGVYTYQPADKKRMPVQTIIVAITDSKGAVTKDTTKLSIDVMTGVEEPTGTPTVYSLNQNFPNPFNPTTNIKYSLPQESKVSLKIYNLIGQEVVTLVNQVQSTGNYKVDFNASNLPSGIYIYRLEAGSFNQVKKMTLLK